MAMRQRPKVANYSDRNDFKNQLKKATPPKDSNQRRQREDPNANNNPNTIIPKKVATSKTVESKRIRHASSGKPVGPPITEKPSEGGGVMTKFRSLDDIPDISDDFNPFEVDEEVEDESYYSNTQYKAVSHGSHPSYQPQNNHRMQQPVTQQQSNHNPPPLPLEMNRGNYHHQKSYSDPEEESEIEEDDEIPKHQYGVGGQKWAPSHLHPPPQNDYDDDWNSDEDEAYSHNHHLPPLPSSQMQKNKVNGKANYSSPPKETKSYPSAQKNQTRHPSPIVYDPKALSNSPQSSHSPEDKLFFDRQPRDVEYKPYTLKDYRKIKPQQYIELGKLKPDLNTDELVAKRANAERIKEFSKNLKQFNKNVMPKRDGNEMNQKIESKKEKAIQYAQNIPKPKVKAEPKPVEPKNVGVATETVEVSRLDELTSKHLQSRKQVDAIKKSLGL